VYTLVFVVFFSLWCPWIISFYLLTGGINDPGMVTHAADPMPFGMAKDVRAGRLSNLRASLAVSQMLTGQGTHPQEVVYVGEGSIGKTASA
jgi:hypothetical protein